MDASQNLSVVPRVRLVRPHLPYFSLEQSMIFPVNADTPSGYFDGCSGYFDGSSGYFGVNRGTLVLTARVRVGTITCPVPGRDGIFKSPRDFQNPTGFLEF